jgi:hypothetical protein
LGLSSRSSLNEYPPPPALVEALRTIAKLQTEFGIWALYEKRSDLEIEHAREISRLLANLQRIAYDNSPWFEPATESKVEQVLDEALRYYSEHTDALKSGDDSWIAESRKRLSEWICELLVLKAVALEDEARRLIGTKRSRRFTRRGRLMLWHRRNLGWLAAVPLPILVVILVSAVVYLHVAG